MAPTEIRNCDSIIFDIDGTLWDASDSCAAAWNDALRKIGYGGTKVTVEAVKSFSGVKIEAVLDSFFRHIPEERRPALLETYAECERKAMRSTGGRLYPDVRSVLAELKRTKKLFIVSNCLHGYVDNFIDFNAFPGVFDGFESSGNTGKPKSNNIAAVVAANGLESAVYVGDTRYDREACLECGVPFVFASYGFGSLDDAPPYRIERFADLPALLG